MSTIGQIAVNVVAKTEKFTSGLKAAQAQLASFDKSIRSATGGLVSLGSLSIAGGVAATVALLKSAADELDRLAKVSDKLGVLPQTLLGLQHAAGLAGLEVETMNKGLQTMLRTISEAGAGDKGAVKTFTELGLSIETLRAMAPEDQFGAIADAMAKIPDAGDRIRLSMEIFGKAGGDMTNVMRGGSAAMKDMIEDSLNLSGVITRDMVGKVEASNDAWTRVWTAIKGVGMQLMILLAPAIELVGHTLAFVVSLFTKFISLINMAIEGLTSFFHTLTGGIFQGEPPAAPVQDLSDETERATKAATAYAQAWAPTAESIRNATRETERLAKEQERITKAGRDFINQMDERAATTGLSDAGQFEHALRAQMIAQFGESAFGVTGPSGEVFIPRSRQAMEFEAQARRAFGNQQNQARLAQQQEDETRQAQDLAQRGAALRERLMTPSERLRAEMEDIQNLLRGGAISEMVAGRAFADIAARAEQEAPAGPAEAPMRFADALEAGTREAWMAIRDRNDPVKEQTDVQKKTLEENKKQTAELKAIAEAARNQGQFVVAEIPH